MACYSEVSIAITMLPITESADSLSLEAEAQSCDRCMSHAERGTSAAVATPPNRAVVTCVHHWVP